VLNFGWMWRGSELNIKDLQALLHEFEQAKYEFMLFAINSEKADFVPKVAFLLDKNPKIKMMLAMRPYLLSPQYAAMLFAGFEQVDSGRLMVNWVNGHNKGEGDEVINFPSNFMDFDVRHKYVEEYFERLNRVFVVGQKNLPPQVIAINKDPTIALAKKHGMFPILHYEGFLKKHKKLAKEGFSRVFVELFVKVLKDGSDKELETKKIISSIDSGYIRNNTFIGYESDIISELERLEGLGVTDVLIGSFDDEDDPGNRLEVHKIVQKMVG
jgi:alkanesulfonate monooxygenase SsuD/methylene tetrahydromethanopterin reductase-like flavin-dependent oxidoreductase (luciferase family)